MKYVNPAHPGECNAPGPCAGCDALDCTATPPCCATPGKLRGGLVVSRHYIALHGLKADELPELARRGIVTAVNEGGTTP